MKFLVDNQLPPLLAGHLRGFGHESAHVVDLGRSNADDLEVWKQAQRGQWILVSKDEDFLFLANRPGDMGRLIWVRLGNCRNRVLLSAFDRVHDNMIAAFLAGQRIVEVR